MTPARELGSHLQFASWRVPQFPRAIEYPQEILEEIRAFACDELLQLSHGGDEVGGILFGTRRDDLLRILTWRPIACEHSQGPGLKLSHSDRMNLAVQLEMARQNADLKDLRPLGWFVSHLSDGVSLSSSDLEIYNGFFPESSQIALVISPQGGGQAHAGFFFREAEDKLRSEASYHVFDLKPLRLAASASAGTVATAPVESAPPVESASTDESVAPFIAEPAPVGEPIELVAPPVAIEPVPEIPAAPALETVTSSEAASAEPAPQPAPATPASEVSIPPEPTQFEPPVQEPTTLQPANLVPPEPMPPQQGPLPPLTRPPLHGHRFESILGADNEQAPPRRFESILAPTQGTTPPPRFASLFGPTQEPASSSEPVPASNFPALPAHSFEHIPTPSFETEPPVPTHERWLWAIPILLALGIAAFVLYQHRPTSDGSVSLRASTDAQTVQLRWDTSSKAIRDADHGEMAISDGGKSSQLSLTADQLHSGKLSYLPQSGDIGFAMTVYPGSGDPIHDYTRLVAPGLHPAQAQPLDSTQPPAQAAPTPPPATEAPQPPPPAAVADQPPQPELVAEVQRLKDDLARERARADELQNVVRILENRLGIKSTPPSRTYRRK